MINVTWLKTFCTLVEVGHFTHTAQKLFMTQSGVSQQVKKLEQQVGVELLIREGKRFTLSDAGYRLYMQGTTILASLSSVAQEIKEDPPYQGRVRIMSPGSVGLKLYPKLLELQSKYPELCIDHRFAPNSDIQRAISDSKIEFGFMSTKPTLAEVSCELVSSEPLLLVTPAKVESVSWERLTELGFIDHPDGAHHSSLLLSANFPEFQHNQLIKTKGFSNQIGLILEPVSKGLGFTVLPAYAVDAFSKQTRIKVHTLQVPVKEPIYLCTHRQKRLPSRAKTVQLEALSCLTDKGKSI